MAKKRSIAPKAKKRVWLTVQAPRIFNSRPIGETLVGEPDQAVGRTIMTNLTTLLNDPKKQHVNIKLQIDGIKGSSASSRVTGYEVVAASIKRNVRRHRDRIDVSFAISTKDKKTVRLKTMIITNGNSPNATQTALRMHVIGWISKYVSETNYDQFVQDVIINKIQRIIRANLKTIFPVKSCDIRVMELVSEDEKDIVKPQIMVEQALDMDKKPVRKTTWRKREAPDRQA